MWLLMQLISFGLLGIIGCSRLALSADLGRPGEKCATELCGQEGAGDCTVTGDGYVCTCRQGFMARPLPEGVMCLSTADLPEDQQRGREQEEGERSATGSNKRVGDEASQPQTADESAAGSEQNPSAEPAGLDSRHSASPGLPNKTSNPFDYMCTNNPCGNPDMAVCVGIPSGYTCICTDGRTPAFVKNEPLCMLDAESLCAGNPCGEGNTCVQNEDAYSCFCAPGFHSGFLEDNSRSGPTCVPDNDVCQGHNCGYPGAAQACAIGANGTRKCTCLSHSALVVSQSGNETCLGGGTMYGTAGLTGPPTLDTETWQYLKDTLSISSESLHSESGETTSGPEESQMGGGAMAPYRPVVQTPYDFLCAGNPCGDPSSAGCLGTPDGYQCICAPGHTPTNAPKLPPCLPTEKSRCAHDPCGTGHTCVQVEYHYACVCAQGYHSEFPADGGGPTCVPDTDDNVCAGLNCGSPAVVEGCEKGEDGQRVCSCLRPGVHTKAPDGGDQCSGHLLLPVVAGAVGTPYLPKPLWDNVKEALTARPEQPPSEHGEEDHVRKEQEGGGAAGPIGEAAGDSSGVIGGAGGRPGGIGGAVPGSSGTEGAEQGAGGVGGTSGGAIGHMPGEEATLPEGGAGAGEPGTEDQQKEEGGGANTLAIAGGVIGALILVAAAGGGAAMYKKRQSHNSDEGEVDFEQPVQEGVEVEADESEILINVSNADWAS